MDKVKPDSAGAHFCHGIALHQLGHYEDALASYDLALALKPDYPEVLNNRGMLLQALNRHGAALESYERALAFNPDYAEALSNRGHALRELRRYDEAVASCNRALSLRPGYVDALNNRGNALLELQRPGEALASYDEALALKPDDPGLLINRGVTLQKLKRHEDAVASYDRALLIDPSSAIAFYNRGNSLQDSRHYVEAISSYDRALLLRPDWADALNNRGNALRELGDACVAVSCYRRAVSLNPDNARFHHALIYTLLRTSADADVVRAQLAAFRLRFERLSEYMHHQNGCDHRPLRIGYVSGDFREHAVAHHIEPILANHDSCAVEVYCYCNHGEADQVTERMMRYATQWRFVAALSDDELAALIRQDRVDILIDLSGHTVRNRLLTFARKPAPVQVTWIGLPASTGLSAIDYRFTDAYVDPPGMTELLHSEKLIRLSSHACFEPEIALPQISDLPALANGYVTFASFNALDKLSPATYVLWARLLIAVPNSRLMMVCDAAASQSVMSRFAAHRIDHERLVFVERLPMMEYLSLHNRADIALDPFPFNGGTVSRHALWMGVPVLTMAGRTPVSRVGLSLMSQVGLDAFVANDEDQYLQIGMRWARDLAGLAEVRRTLRQRVQDAPFSDVQAYTREVEAAYGEMWRTWCGDE